MTTIIKYNVCRSNLGESVTNAQYAAFKRLVRCAIEGSFPSADVTVGDSDFCNVSTCHVLVRGPVVDDDEPISREDVEAAVSDIDDSWWED